MTSFILGNCFADFQPPKLIYIYIYIYSVPNSRAVFFNISHFFLERKLIFREKNSTSPDLVSNRFKYRLEA